MALPLILTCGEPAGIGPEIAARLAGMENVPRFVWLGDPRHLPAGTKWAEITDPSQPSPHGQLPVLRHDLAAPVLPGRPDPANAPGIIAVIERAARLVQSGAASGMVTAPISKQALKEGAGFAFPGHTEFLAHLAGEVDVVMMLASTSITPPCRTIPATIHIPLEDVPSALTADLLDRVIRITHAAMRRDFGMPNPRIAVAGLNPHAGEGGTMGRQEVVVITPTLDRLRDEGMAIMGPLPADTMFHAPAREKWDVAVCCYHDQALIPIKTLDFSGGVNVTLGLPFVRTSPDHGTAFDIAGTGRADPASTLAALRMAADMVSMRAER